MNGTLKNRIRTQLRLLLPWLPPLLSCALALGAGLFVYMPAVSFAGEYAAVLLCGACLAFSPVFPARGGIFAEHTLLFGVFLSDACLALAGVLGLGGMAALAFAALLTAALAPACVLACRLLLRLRADMEAYAGTAVFLLALGLCMLPRALPGWPAAAVHGAIDALDALTTVRAAFALVFAAIVARVAFRGKKAPQWDALAVTLAVAGACAAITFLPPVEAALSVNDIDLYDLAHILMAAAAAYQLVRLFILRVLAKESGPLGAAMRTCCLAAALYALLALTPAEDTLRAVRLPLAPVLCVLALLIYGSVRAHFFPQARGGTARLLETSRAVLFAGIGWLVYAQHAGPGLPAADCALFAAAAVYLGGAHAKEGAAARTLLGLAALGALSVLAARLLETYPAFTAGTTLARTLVYIPAAAAPAARCAQWAAAWGKEERLSFSFYEKRKRNKKKNIRG